MDRFKNHSLELYEKINARAFCFCVFLVAVFYINQDYYDVLGEKARIISVFSVIILVVEMVFTVFTKNKTGEEKVLITSLDLSMVCFGIIAIVSGCLSDYKKESFIGNSGFSVGGYFIVLMIVVYFWLSRLLCRTRGREEIGTEIEIYFFIIMISALLQFLLCIINVFGVDLLGTYERLGISNEYLGTMGHVNNLAGYIAMVVSLCTGLLIEKRSRTNSIITTLVLFLGWILIFICRSDGAIIGAAFGQAIFILICLKDKSFLPVLRKDLFIIFLSAIFVDILTLIFSGLSQRLDVIAGIFINQKIYVIPFVLAIIISIGLEKKSSQDIEKLMPLIQKVYRVLLIFGVIAAVVGIILTIDDEWGTNRGFVWRVSIDIVRDFNLKEILVGVGPECYLYKSMELHGEEILNRLPGTGLANAHCDYLNFLVTTGVLGLIAYLGIFISIIRGFIKTNILDSKFKRETIAVFLAIVGYLGQSWMENQMALTFAVLIFFISIYRAICSSYFMALS